MLDLIVIIMEIILGALCIIMPEVLYPITPFLSSILLVGVGVFRIVVAVRHKEYKTLDTDHISQGIVNVVSGIAVFILMHDGIGLVGSIWGLIGMNRGAKELNKAIYRISHKRKDWHLIMLLAIFGLVCSLLLLIDPVNKMHEHMAFIGLEIIFIAIDNGVNSREVVRRFVHNE